MHSPAKKKVIGLIISAIVILLLAPSAFSETDTTGCTLKEGVDYFQKESGWLKLNVDGKKNLYVQEFTPRETHIMSKVDLNLKNYDDTTRIVKIRIRENIDNPISESSDLAYGMIGIEKEMMGDWFTFALHPKITVDESKKYYLLIENDGNLTNVKMAASTDDIYKTNKMIYLGYSSSEAYQPVNYNATYDLLFREFNCGEKIEPVAVPVPAAPEQPAANVTEQNPVEAAETEQLPAQESPQSITPPITAQAAKEVESAPFTFSEFLNSTAAKIVGGVAVLSLITVLAFNAGRRKFSRPAPMPKETEKKIADNTVGSIAKYKEDYENPKKTFFEQQQMTKDRNEQIFKGKF